MTGHRDKKDKKVDILHSRREGTRNPNQELQEHGSLPGPTLPIKPRLV